MLPTITTPVLHPARIWIWRGGSRLASSWSRAKVRLVYAQTLVQCQRRQDPTPGVILERQRRAKQGHKAIAQELVNRAAVAVHRVQGEFEEALQQGMHALGTQALGQAGGVRQVAEQHRDLFEFALQSTAGGEDLLGQMAGRIGQGRRVAVPGLDQCIGRERHAAGGAEFTARRILVLTLRTDVLEGGTTRRAEPGLIRVLVLTLRTVEGGGSWRCR